MTAIAAATPEALDARVRHDLALLTLPAPRWMADRTLNGQPMQDVVVIGAGMAGLAAAAALRNMGIGVVNLDARRAGYEGPWATTARMETLRSPKTLTGPALGIPSLTFRAWFEARFGAAEWEALDKIPRLMWMDYLRWFREVLALDVRNEHRVTMMRPGADHVALDVSTPEGPRSLLARRVVLATGRDGLGGPALPPQAAGLPRDRWAHSSDQNDYRDLAGKRVVVIGAGASAMDSAATALEEGAARVDLLIRRTEIPRINRGKGMGSPGFVAGYASLPDEWKWRVNSYIAREQVPPPRASVLRVSRHPNAHFRQGWALQAARVEGGEVVIETTRGEVRCDFVIFSTGFKVDWAARPFLAPIAQCARSWADRGPMPADAEPSLAGLPDLGPAFEFLPRDGAPGCDGVSRVHCFCYPAMMSHGTVSGDIPAISDGAARLAQGIAALFYVEDIEEHFARAQAYAEPEIEGDEWTPYAGEPEGRIP